MPFLNLLVNGIISSSSRFQCQLCGIIPSSSALLKLFSNYVAPNWILAVVGLALFRISLSLGRLSTTVAESRLINQSRNLRMSSTTSQAGSKFHCGAISTWDFGKIAIKNCIPTLLSANNSAMDAVEIGIRAVEVDTQDQYYVGVGGFPNADGDMEFDAAIMDDKLRYGAVMSLQNIRNPISVARSILEKCVHNILTGSGALQWALDHGFTFDEHVLTEDSRLQWQQWKSEMRQHTSLQQISANTNGDDSHDTVCLICLDQLGRLAVGTSTSGWKFKHPGRVGDSPLIGSGLYCHGQYGAAAATGDGEEVRDI
jgi:isoaspartyl peptidase/L-asparaginase-like protein (Ntn-hydrolase superfamily)